MTSSPINALPALLECHYKERPSNQQTIMINLRPFQPTDFDAFISWIDNPELLVTIAGNVFSFPVTHPQLQKYLEDEGSISFTVMDAQRNKPVGHAELVIVGDGMYKIDKLLIGDPSLRGKGIGEIVMHELLEYAFNRPGIEIVELNVFDWNAGAIRCYEKVGFKMNDAKKSSYEVNGKQWTALNMTVQKNKWTR
jgi:RimJ/RimL family protein N-acetyltransferase